MRLLVATSNAGKLRDFAHAAGAFAGVEILPLPGIGATAAPAEDAASFEGNALIKARAYAGLAPGEIVVADDSGIVVEGLGGAPGVRSARYAEDEGFALNQPLDDRNPDERNPDDRNLDDRNLDDRNLDGRNLDGRNLDDRNLACLLDRAAGLGDRRAAYECVLVAVRDAMVLGVGRGRVEGVLLRQRQGSGGFGYDPAFLLPDLGLTMAEVDADTRQRLSHRGLALVDLLEVLRG